MALLRSLMYAGFIVAVIGGWFLNRRKSGQDQKPEDTPLIDLTDPAALPAALHHTRWQYRLAAVEALRGDLSPNTLSTLINMLDDPVLEVRETASAGIAAFGDTAVPALDEVLATGKLPARESAIQTLQAIATPATIPLLIKALRDDQSAWVRMPAAKALASIGGAEADVALRNALQDPHPDVVATVDGLLHPTSSIPGHM